MLWIDLEQRKIRYTMWCFVSIIHLDAKSTNFNLIKLNVWANLVSEAHGFFLHEL